VAKYQEGSIEQIKTLWQQIDLMNYYSLSNQNLYEGMLKELELATTETSDIKGKHGGPKTAKDAFQRPDLFKALVQRQIEDIKSQLNRH